MTTSTSLPKKTSCGNSSKREGAYSRCNSRPGIPGRVNPFSTACGRTVSWEENGNPRAVHEQGEMKKGDQQGTIGKPAPSCFVREAEQGLFSGIPGQSRKPPFACPTGKAARIAGGGSGLVSPCKMSSGSSINPTPENKEPENREKRSGHQVQHKDEYRYCDGDNHHRNGADVDRSFILALVIVDQTGG